MNDWVFRKATGICKKPLINYFKIKQWILGNTRNRTFLFFFHLDQFISSSFLLFNCSLILELLGIHFNLKLQNKTKIGGRGRRPRQAPVRGF
jgi:hypothetical protein